MVLASRWSNWALAIAAIIGICVTIKTLKAIQRQALIMIRQSRTMQRQARTMELQTVATQTAADAARNNALAAKENIRPMTLTMTKPEVDDYARTNQYAMLMLFVAGSDYFACRCCIVNMMSSGFRLASEAVEKLLKAYIFLETKGKTTLEQNDRHNPYLLKEELQSALKARDTELDNFDGLLNQLFGHYQSRYPDNKGQGPASSQELPQIDELFIYLVEKLPMPDEVKYRSGFFVAVCDPDVRQFWRDYHWATEQNSLLQTKMPLFEQTYKEVLEHLYPKTSQATG